MLNDRKLIILLLSIIGLLASIPPLLETLDTGESYCTTDCSALYNSPYAKIGPVHISYLAPAYFAAVVLLAATWRTGERRAYYPLLGLIALGVAFIPYLVYVEVFLVGVICVYCTIMHVCIIGSAIAIAGVQP